MDPPTAPRPARVLLRDLALATALAIALYLVFGVFNVRFLRGLSTPEVLLLEGGAILAVAAAVARALANAASAFLARQGLQSRGAAVRVFLNILIAVGAVLALFRLTGVSADSLLLGAGFTGIVLGLAAQTVLANVFAGLLLIFADPFRPGDRVSFVSGSYGLLGPTYPHESLSPSYGGTVNDVGLVYTVLALDSGGFAKIPNAVVISALVLEPRGALVHRVRFTLPNTVGLTAVEATVPELAGAFPAPFPGAPPPRIEVADLSATTWDAVAIVWSAARDLGAVRDKVLRIVQPKVGLPAAPPR